MYFCNKLEKKPQHVQQITSKKQNQTEIQINKIKRKNIYVLSRRVSLFDSKIGTYSFKPSLDLLT